MTRNQSCPTVLAAQSSAASLAPSQSARGRLHPTSAGTANGSMLTITMSMMMKKESAEVAPSTFASRDALQGLLWLAGLLLGASAPTANGSASRKRIKTAVGSVQASNALNQRVNHWTSVQQSPCHQPTSAREARGGSSSSATTPPGVICAHATSVTWNVPQFARDSHVTLPSSVRTKLTQRLFPICPSLILRRAAPTDVP